MKELPLSLGRCSSHEFHSWVKAPLCELNFSASEARGKIKGLFVTASHVATSFARGLVGSEIEFRRVSPLGLTVRRNPNSYSPATPQYV